MTNIESPEIRLAKLEVLKQEGAITEQEFLTLQSELAKDSRPRFFFRFELRLYAIVACTIIGIVAIDHLKGPIFPHFVYCAAGAGAELQRPAEIKANSWMAGNGCSANDPSCATSWITTPASSVCLHGTFWDAIRLAFS